MAKTCRAEEAGKLAHYVMLLNKSFYVVLPVGMPLVKFLYRKEAITDVSLCSELCACYTSTGFWAKISPDDRQV